MTGPADLTGRRRSARARALVAGLLLAAYVLLLVFLAYLATIDATATLTPLAVAGGIGLLASLAVVVANLRVAAQPGTSSARGLLWSSVALIVVAVAGLLGVGIFELIAADTTVGMVTLAAIVLVLGPLVPAAVSLPAAHRR